MSEISVADLCDEHEGTIEVCETQFRDLGGKTAFSGPIRTVRCHEDNSLVKATLAEPGEGCVLVVDGGGSLHRALDHDHTVVVELTGQLHHHRTVGRRRQLRDGGSTRHLHGSNPHGHLRSLAVRQPGIVGPGPKRCSAVDTRCGPVQT